MKMSSSTRPCLALLVLAATSVAGFEIVKNEPATSYVKEDGVLSLLCESDTYWEWCTFKAPAGKICDYVWTKEDRGNGRWNISIEACNVMQSSSNLHHKPPNGVVPTA